MLLGAFRRQRSAWGRGGGEWTGGLEEPGRQDDGRPSRQQRRLHDKAFSTFARGLDSLQATGTNPTSAAAHMIEIAEMRPAPSRATVDADAELDSFRLKIVGLIRFQF